MTPRPFYRSRLFWLDLPGLVFLLWGWWLSLGHVSQASWGWTHPWCVWQSAGDLVAVWDSEVGPEWGEFRGSHEAVPMMEDREWRTGLPENRQMYPTYRYVIVPYYQVVLAYVAAWLLALAWWQRRKSRLLKLHTAP